MAIKQQNRYIDMIMMCTNKMHVALKQTQQIHVCSSVLLTINFHTVSAETNISASKSRSRLTIKK